ncbi:MAG: monofunctional biosynthetic peptidoglycan transglycosylase [Betaproteobacteria bacterium]|nr:monofunctional biosynthetic peptidoglycan transglycosylase [Betaproteobacteria bacterium]MBI2961211.1 monofunctional biosynthetic peptidoglycan transglycosylase [Betaproteobacteria bacterium]
MRRFWKLCRYAVLALVAALAVYEGWVLARIAWWIEHDPGATPLMARRADELRSRGSKTAIEHRWIRYERISANLKRAIVVAEDAKFLDHEGFDWAGIQQAMEKNRKRGKIVAGGSTITQQLAKNLFLSSERSLARKAQETLITVALEALMSKRRILEIYLNVAEWGEGIFGAEAAARHYFGVGAGALSAEQAARLAAMLPRPRYYERNRGSIYLAQYAQRILARLPSAQVP